MQRGEDMTMTTAKPTKNAAIYCRVSTEDQAKNYSLPTQMKAAVRYAHDSGFEAIGDPYIDDGFSGYSLDRPALDSLRKSVLDGKIEAVIVFDVDRLSRRLIDLLLLEEEFRRSAVEMHFIQYPVDQTAEGYLFLQIRGGFAEYERHKFLERSRRGKIARAEAGVPGYGCLPLGYYYVSEGRFQARWEIQPSEAVTVKNIFAWCVEEGLSVRGIARRLNEARVSPKRGKGWSQSSIRRILHYEGYTGMAHWNKTEKVQPKSRKTTTRVRINNKSVLRPREQWIPIEIPVIISRELFDAALARLKNNSRRSAPKKSRDYLLTGRLFCSCGLRMAGNAVHDKRYYRCNGRDSSKPREDRCRIGLVNSDDAESWVWDRVMEFLEEPERVAVELGKHQSRSEESNDLHGSELYVRRAARLDIERRQRQWDHAYEADAIDLQEYKTKTTGLKKRRQDLQLEIAEIERRVAVTNASSQVLMSLKNAVTKVTSKLIDADFSRRRWILDALDVRVAIGAGGRLEMSGLVDLGESNSPEAHNRLLGGEPKTSS